MYSVRTTVSKREKENGISQTCVVCMFFLFFFEGIEARVVCMLRLICLSLAFY